MEFDNINKYKINENSVVSDIDKKHIENYQQLIKFFETSIQNSMSNEGTNYNSLHNSCVKCIRFLDNLILTYSNAIQTARAVNQTLDKIITENKKNSELGNE